MIQLPDDVVLIEHQTAIGTPYQRLCRRREIWSGWRAYIVNDRPENVPIEKVLEWLDNESEYLNISSVYRVIAAEAGETVANGVLQRIVDAGGIAGLVKRI